MRYLLLCWFVLAASFSDIVNARHDAELVNWLNQVSATAQQNHNRLLQEAKALKSAVASYCHSQQQDALAAAQNQWRNLMQQWMQVVVLQFGPLMEEDRRLRIQAWPMRPGLMEKQVRRLLKHADSVTLGTIKEASVVVQGLPALEYLLFEKSSPISQVCPVTLAIADHLIEQTGILQKAWTGDFLAEFTESADPAGIENNVDEFLNGLVTALQQISRRKLKDPLQLNLNNKEGKLKELESFYSRNSLTNIRSNVAALDLYLNGGDGYGLDDYQQAVDPEGVTAHLINDQLREIQTSLNGFTQPLESAIGNQKQRRELRKLHQQLVELQFQLESQLFKQLGITRDFNSEDGD